MSTTTNSRILECREYRGRAKRNEATAGLAYHGFHHAAHLSIAPPGHTTRWVGSQRHAGPGTDADRHCKSSLFHIRRNRRFPYPTRDPISLFTDFSAARIEPLPETVPATHPPYLTRSHCRVHPACRRSDHAGTRVHVRPCAPQSRYDHLDATDTGCSQRPARTGMLVITPGC